MSEQHKPIPRQAPAGVEAARSRMEAHARRLGPHIKAKAEGQRSTRPAVDETPPKRAD